ncbi:MAG: aldo/keto reductase [Actinobacteria bacterium]|nr:aldo/keto reductase [Actinomycetota bacterium]
MATTIRDETGKRRLGRTDIEITPIGVGCWQFAGGRGLAGYYWPGLPEETTNEIVKAALDGGINWFDTAESYGSGRSERNLAKALKAAGVNNGDVVVATKWLPIMRTAKSIRSTIGKRIDCLGGFGIDLYQVHLPTSFSSVKDEMNAMADLVESGNIRSVGISNYRAGGMRKAEKALQERGLTLASNQVHYNLMNRKIESNGILETAKELGVTIIAYSPLEQGILTGKFHRNPELLKSGSWMRRLSYMARPNLMEKVCPLIEALEEIAEAHEVTASQVALNWITNAHGDTVVAIPGASKVSQMEQNVGSMRFKLTEDEMKRIDTLSTRFK